MVKTRKNAKRDKTQTITAIKTSGRVEDKKIEKKKTIDLSKFQQNMIYIIEHFKTVQRGSLECKLEFKETQMSFKINKLQSMQLNEANKPQTMQPNGAGR